MWSSIPVLLLFVAQETPPPLDAATKASVDQVFAEYDKASSPGCALGVIRDGKLIYRNAYGSADLDFMLPLSPNSVFDIGSTSKQFSAMSILLLEQDGKLNIDDDIRKLVPEIPSYKDGLITIRHLLNHTSGLRDYLTLSALALRGDDDFYTDDDVLAMIARQRELNFAPGSDYLYSNSGFFLLSTIVKRASGKTLRQFADERILKPLRMNSTHFHDDHTQIVRNRATGYAPVPKPDGDAVPQANRFKIAMSTLDMVGDGGIYTSVADLAKWDQNFYSHKVGGAALLSKMQTPSKLSTGKDLTYALGLMVAPYRGLPSVSHGGSWAGFRAEFLRFPGEKFSVICLCNLASTNPSKLARQVADIFLAAKLSEPQPPPPAPSVKIQLPAVKIADLEPYAGRYKSEELGGVVYELKPDADGALRLLNGKNRPLRPRGGDAFDGGMLQLLFEREASGGAIKGFVAQAGRVRNIRFTRLP